MTERKPFSVDQHIKLYRSRGLQFSDEETVRYWLKHVGYHRLSIYAKPFQLDDTTFKEGTTFKDIISLYRFDRKLRLHLLDILEKIESSIKSHMIEYLVEHGGTNLLMQPIGSTGVFVPEKEHEVMELITNLITKNRHHSAIKYYRKKGEEIPVWVLIQIATLGEMNRIYQALLNNHKIVIADIFGFTYEIFKNFFEGFRTARNICAHHDRLWNNKFRTLKLKNNPIREYLLDQHSLGSYLLVTLYFCRKIDLGQQSLKEWIDTLLSLGAKYHIDMEEMGIHNDRSSFAKEIIA